MDSHWICTASTGHNLNRMYRNMEQLIGMANNMLNKTMTMATKGFVPSKPCHQNDNGCHHTIYNFCYLGQHAVSNSIFFGGHQGTMIQLKRRPTAPTGTTASMTHVSIPFQCTQLLAEQIVNEILLVDTNLVILKQWQTVTLTISGNFIIEFVMIDCTDNQ